MIDEPGAHIELVHRTIDGGLYCRVGQFGHTRFKIRIPAGISGWTVSWQAYAAPETGLLRMALDHPAPAEVQDVQDARFTLQDLWAGKALRAVGPPGSGGMSVSTYQSDTTFVTDRERWLYCDAQYPGGSLIALESRFWGTPAVEPKPLPTGPDAQEEAIQFALDAGLVAALVKYIRLTRELPSVTPYSTTVESGVMAALTSIARMARPE